MRSGNPTLSLEKFRQGPLVSGDRMTIEGTTNKSLILLILLILSAGFTWRAALAGEQPLILMGAGAIVGFVIALATAFKPLWAPVTAPVYALAQGLFLGGVSAFAERQYPGIPMTAVGLTLGVALAFFMLYKTGTIKVTEQLRAGIMAATFGIVVGYLGLFLAGLLGLHLPVGFSSGPVGIGISLLIVGVASFNLLLDFDLIDRAAAQGAPKAMEWYGAFALMVTLVWLYLEMLRLLMRLQDRR